MKILKRIISWFWIIAIVISCVTPAFATTDYQSDGNFFQWIAESTNGFTGGLSQRFLGYITGPVDIVAVCPESSDAKHHAKSCVWDSVAGHYLCTCDYCGQTFFATKTELSDAYDNMVSAMPATVVTDNGLLIWKPEIHELLSSPASQANGITISDGLPVTSNGETVAGPMRGERYVVVTDNNGGRYYDHGLSLYFSAPVDGVYTIKSAEYAGLTNVDRSSCDRKAV